jgi:hypothetical protein
MPSNLDSKFGHSVKARMTVIRWPGRKTNKLGSIVRVSGPLRYWPVLLMTIADGLLKQDRAVAIELLCGPGKEPHNLKGEHGDLRAT